MVKGINVNKSLEDYKKTLSSAELKAFNALSKEVQISIMQENYSGKVPTGSLWNGTIHTGTAVTDTPMIIVDAIYNDVKGLGTSATFAENLDKITPVNILDVFELYSKKYGETLVSAISNEFNIKTKDRAQLLNALGEKLNKKLEEIDGKRRIDLSELNSLSGKILSSWRTCNTNEIDKLFAKNIIPIKAEKLLPTPQDYIQTAQVNHGEDGYERSFKFADGTIKSVKYINGKWSSITEKTVIDSATNEKITSGTERFLDESGSYEEYQHSRTKNTISRYENNKLVETKIKQEEPENLSTTTTYDPKSGEILSRQISYGNTTHTINEFYENNKLIKSIEYSSGENGGVRTDTFYNENGEARASRKLSKKINTNRNSSEITIIHDGKTYTYTSSTSEPDENGIIHSEFNGKKFQTKFSEDNISVENLTDKKTTSLDLNKLFKDCTDVEKKAFIEKLKSFNGQVLFDIASELDDIKHKDKSLYISAKNLIYKVLFINGRTEGAYSKMTNELFATENTMIHELGHALDNTSTKSNPLMNLVFGLTSAKNKNFKQAFEKELENFESTAEEKNLEKPYAATVPDEFLAESYDMLMTGDCSSGLTVLEYFPESFIESAKHIEWVRSLPDNLRK